MALNRIGKNMLDPNFVKEVDDARSGLETATAQLADIAISPKQYGATGLGLIDDTQAIQNALSENNVVNISGGTFLVDGTIKLTPGKGLKGDKTGTILIAHGNPITTFELTYLNEVCGFNIKQTNASWAGNMFEESSKTLESSDAPAFVNLRNEIHDLSLSVNSNFGTFKEISAYQKDEAGNLYRVYGMWNSKTYNIKLKGYLEYFCRTYTFRDTGTPMPWITVNEFDNISGDYCGYGWFGSKNPSTMSDDRYKNYNIRVRNAVIQCYTKSKNFAFLSGGSVQFIDCIPYDWGVENTTKQNAFLISNIGVLPKILMRNTPGLFDLVVPVSNAQEKQVVINKSLVTDPNGSIPVEKSVKAFEVGDLGGTTYPTYKRIAKFKPYSTTPSTTFFNLHNEQSKSLAAEFGLTYESATDTLFVEMRQSFGYLTSGIKFYHKVETDGYVSIYMMFVRSSIGWYIENTPPPFGNAELHFIYLTIRDFGSTLDTTGMKETIPVLAYTYGTDMSRIGTDVTFAGSIGYDKTKGLMGYGRLTQGFTYSPLIRTQEHTAITTADSINFTKAIWEMKPRVIIQPLVATSTNPYPSTIGYDKVTVSDLEIGKKYLITLIYDGL